MVILLKPFSLPPHRHHFLTVSKITDDTGTFHVLLS